MWKYRTEEDVDMDELDALGREGWELVTIVIISTVSIFYFKKPLLRECS